MAAKKARSLTTQADVRLLKAFGAKIRQAREKKKLSVYDVAGEDLEIKSRQHWQRIENGQKNINLTTVFKIAKTLEVPVESFFSGLEK